MLKPIRCKTLLGHDNLDFSIECLQSFIHNCADEIHLQVFEDGTITNADEQKLLSALKNSIVVKKADRDRQLEPILADFPACKSYRNSTNYAQKIFDMMLYDDHDVLYIDSDIYFLKKFSLPTLDEMPVFMADVQNAYSFTPVDIMKINIPLFPNVNSGIFYFPQNLFSLAFVEQLLTDAVISKGVKKKIPCLEQTIWSFLAARSRSMSYFNNKQVIMADFTLKTDPDMVAVHLIYYFRTHIKKLRLMEPGNHECSPISLNIQTAYLDKMDYTIEKLSRKMKRVFRR